MKQNLFLKLSKTIAIGIISMLLCFTVKSQITVTDNHTALQLANALIGGGVTITSATKTCKGAQNGIYTTGGVDPVGIPFGIVLSTGLVIDSTLGTGLANPASSFASYDWGLSFTDPDLATLTSGSLFDECALVVSFIPAGDSIKFKYVFGSEEYPDFACSDFNDVFGFFILGGAFVTPTNMAIIPGTTIPVCINSINCGAGAAGTLSTCTALGGGSPYCAYYVDNSLSSYLVLNGLTTVMTAAEPVTPCTPYTIKMAIADVFDGIFDSDVFIECGSLTSPAITGIPNLCVGTTTTLSIATTGGSWSSGSTAIATVGAATGIVTGVSLGTTLITYTMAGGCVATYSVTVGPTPISGITSSCIGGTETLTDATPGGTWSSGTSSVATVGTTTGVVYAVSAGTSTISYTSPAGCVATIVFTVNPNPAPISGTTTICAGATTALASTTTGGTWSSSNTTVATVVSTTGLVTGVTNGTTTITYTLPTGCYITTVVTVGSFSPITGMGSICAGSTLTLSDATAGGTWSSLSTAIATIGTTSGVVYGVATGIATINYTTGIGCITTATVTINSSPTPILGSTFICLGSTSMLTDAIAGGTWTSSNLPVATVGSISGVVSGVSNGTSNITYTLPGGCYTTILVTVDVIQPITGTPTLCVGSTTTLADISTGGTWTVGSSAVATIGSSSGVVYGVSAGTSTITYTASTCVTYSSVTVNPLPSPIVGPANLCIGDAGTFTDPTTGGTWSSSNPAVAVIGSSTGIISTLAAGTTTISYTSASGCSVTTLLTIIGLPLITPVSLCVGSTATATCSASGGTWSCAVNPIATIDPGTGVVSGLAPGSIPVTYTTATGCSSAALVNINPIPSPITGIPVICQNSITMLSDSTFGGTWSVNNAAIATINNTGLVSGITAGNVSVTYTSSAGCITTYNLTLNPIPTPVLGTDTLCVGNITTLTDAITGGTWTSNNIQVATIDATTGILSGLTPGNTLITYTSGSGCSITYLFTVIGAAPLRFYVQPDACIGDHINVALTEVGSSTVFFHWNFDGANVLSATSPSDSSGPYVISYPASGTYVIQLTGLGTAICPSLSTQDTINIHKNPDASIKDPIYLNNKDGVFCLGDSVLLSAAYLAQGYFYFWTPINFFEQNNRSYVYGQIQTPAFVTLTVNSPYGCSASDSIYLNPIPCCKLNFPNAFSPNGDGLNDIFRPVMAINQPIHTFVVVNRWGQVVYESDNNKFAWDGTFNGVLQDIGTYFYYISYDCNGTVITEKGDVTLVR